MTPLHPAGAVLTGGTAQRGGAGTVTGRSCLVGAGCHPAAGPGNADGSGHGIQGEGGAGLHQKTDLKAACLRGSKHTSHLMMKSAYDTFIPSSNKNY